MISYFVLRTPLKDECLKRWLPFLPFTIRFLCRKTVKINNIPSKKKMLEKDKPFKPFIPFRIQPLFWGPLGLKYCIYSPTNFPYKLTVHGSAIILELPWILRELWWLIICISSLYMGSWARWFQANWNIYARQIELAWILWSTGFSFIPWGFVANLGF